MNEINMIRRLPLRLVAAALTFVVGVVLSSLVTVLDAPGPAFPEPYEVAPTNAVRSSCFPGRSVETEWKTDRYFPLGLFGPDERSDQFRAGWYAKYLVAMHEPSLLMGDDLGRERYRFVWLRSFHHPVVIRVERLGDQRFLVTKEFTGRGGYEPGKPLVDTTRSLSPGEWARLLYLLDQTCYWALPTEHEGAGDDGAQWILEGQMDGRYHLVDRWSPERGRYREVCTYLLQISGLEIDPLGEAAY